jgi:hypothetical protein
LSGWGRRRGTDHGPGRTAVELVSYRAESGFTLTVALNFADHRMIGIASNSEQWFPARGTFEVVDG